MQPPGPPPPLPHQRFLPWFLGLSRKAQILGCAALVFGCALFLSVSSVFTQPPALHSLSTQIRAVDKSIAPTDTPTAAPIIAATAIPTTEATTMTNTNGTPLLGGPISDFIGKYGPPNDHSDATSSHWLRDSSSNVDGLIVSSLTHPNQADSIDVQAVNGNMPTTDAAIALCTAYNPRDAREVKRISLVDASGKDAGFDVVYVSASLAHTFMPGDFTDSNGNNVTPGTFDIQYLYKGDGTQNIDSCSILLGEQQTHG